MTPEERIAWEEKLATYEGPDRVLSSMELYEKFKTLPPPRRYDSGISKLDEALQGFEPGEVIVVGGPTANGKTFLCDTIVRNLREKAVFSCFFTYEVTPRKFVQWHQDERSVVFLPAEHKSFDVAWIKERCAEAKLKYGCRAMVIDHLHYVVNMGTQNNMSLEIGQTMRYLKQEIALGLDLVVFLVAHLGKCPPHEEPSMNFLRDSSFVSQEADSVLVIWRRQDRDVNGEKLSTFDQGLAAIKIEKARRSGVMHLKINIKRDGMKLVESNEEPEAPHGKTKRIRVDESFGSLPKPSWMDLRPDPGGD